MIGILIPFLIALALLASLAFWLNDQDARIPANGQFVQNGAGRSEWRFELPPKDIVEKIFDPEEQEFVFGASRGRARLIFFQERRKLALLWLHRVRDELRRLMKLHALIARQDIQVDTLAEIQLGWHYLRFLTFYAVLSWGVRILGPFKTRAVISTFARREDRICAISDRILQGVATDLLDGIRIAWATKSGLR